MKTQDTTPQRAMVIDMAQLIQAVFRRKGILLFAILAAIATGMAWHATAKRKYTATVSFVRNQPDEAPALGGLGSFSILGLGGQSSEPPLLKFIDKYLASREFISHLQKRTIQGQPLPKALSPDTSAEGFYGVMSDRIKVTKETGLISITLWDHDAGTSLQLANLVFDQYETDFDNARHKSIQENLTFANEMVGKSRRDLVSAASALRDFLERNRGLGSPALEQARNELMMNEKLAEERYMMAEKERGALEIKNERNEQGLVIIERPFFPSSPVYPKRLVTMSLPLFIGLFLALVLIGILERRTWITLKEI
jgi:capsule polysaccharide export protein KpsE/RkpR